MTAICVGGVASGPKPGVKEIQQFLGAAITDYLAAKGMAWAASLFAGVAFMSFDVTTFCAVDPPALPNVDAARIAGYFSPTNPLGAAQLADDAFAIVGHFLWSDLCQCSSGAQPTPPTPVSQPPNYVLNPPQLAPAPKAPSCGFIDQVLGAWFGAGNGKFFLDMGVREPIPPGVTSIDFHETPTQTGVQKWPVTVTHSFSTAGGGIGALGTFSYSLQSTQNNTEVVHEIPWPAGAGQWVVNWDCGPSDPTSAQWFISGAYYCGPAANSPVQACCPPDPTLTNMIVQVISLENQILASLASRLEYTLSTSHGALTLTGTFAVTGIIGTLVTVNAGVPTNPELFGNPKYEWNLGWITFTNADGFLLERRITREFQLILDPLLELATHVNYALTPGVTATIRELAPA